MNILFSVNIVLPLFLMIAVGYLLTSLKLFDADFLIKANNLSFRVLLPVLIFNSIYKTDLSVAFDPPLIAFAVVSIVGLAALLVLIVPAFVKENNRKGIAIQGIFRNTVLMFGIPLCQEIYGVNGAGLAAVLCVFILPVLNASSIVVLNLYDKQSATTFKSVALDIMKNPIMIGCILGLGSAVIGIKFPFIIEKSLSNMAAIVTPFTLMVLGGTFKFKNMMKNIRILTFITLCKIFIMPVIMLIIAILIGFRGAALCALLCLFATPTATGTYPLAFQYNGDAELAGQIIVTTAMFSVFSIFIFLMIGKTLLLL